MFAKKIMKANLLTLVQISQSQCIRRKCQIYLIPPKKSNVLTGKIILAPRYINTSATEVTVKEFTPDITRNEYMSLTITVSANVIKMYVDGTLLKTYNGNEFSDFSKWKSTPVQPATVYNIGTIAAAVMYNKALSDNDVTELHAYFKSLEVE